jgi:hypothetical protein
VSKNSNGSIGNRTRDLSGFSAVPQPTAPPRASININITAPLAAASFPYYKDAASPSKLSHENVSELRSLQVSWPASYISTDFTEPEDKLRFVSNNKC